MGENGETGQPSLPQGVRHVPLRAHADHRGVFTEIYRAEWFDGPDMLQWNAVRSEAGVLRGVHVHHRHHDVLTVVQGRASIGLQDLRTDSPTHGLATLVPLVADEPAVLTIPPGVAHGFLFHEPSIHVYGVSHYFDPRDELGCRWDDPDVTIPWPVETATLSKRDERAGTLAEMIARYEAGSAAG